MQAQLTHILGLHHTNSRVSIDSITSFAESNNTKKAYKEFCKNLHLSGVTKEMISRKQTEILNTLKPQNTAIRSQINGSSIADRIELPIVSDFLVEILLRGIY